MRRPPLGARSRGPEGLEALQGIRIARLEYERPMIAVNRLRAIARVLRRLAQPDPRHELLAVPPRRLLQALDRARIVLGGQRLVSELLQGDRAGGRGIEHGRVLEGIL